MAPTGQELEDKVALKKIEGVFEHITIAKATRVATRVESDMCDLLDLKPCKVPWLVVGDWNMTFIFPYIRKNNPS